MKILQEETIWYVIAADMPDGKTYIGITTDEFIDDEVNIIAGPFTENEADRQVVVLARQLNLPEFKEYRHRS